MKNEMTRIQRGLVDGQEPEMKNCMNYGVSPANHGTTKGCLFCSRAPLRGVGAFESRLIQLVSHRGGAALLKERRQRRGSPRPDGEVQGRWGRLLLVAGEEHLEEF